MNPFTPEVSHAKAYSSTPWAYRYLAKISAHIQRGFEKLPKLAQDIGGKAQVRLWS